MASRKQRNARATSMVLLIAVAMLIGGWWLQAREHTYYTKTENRVVAVQDNNSHQEDIIIPQIEHIELAQLTQSRAEQIISHIGYTVSYNFSWLIPNWVAYELTSKEVAGTEERSNKFVPDPDVRGAKVVSSDYSHSGYDRGHMAPAADMKWSEQAMCESFYMTNICPQNHGCNAGDWKEIEEMGRDVAVEYDNIFICCGPIVDDTTLTIGNEHTIVVPQAFFKTFLRQKKDGSWTSLGFIMENKAGSRPLMTYMVSVDSIEYRTGIDCYYQLPDSIEAMVEADFNLSDWTIRK